MFMSWLENPLRVNWMVSKVEDKINNIIACIIQDRVTGVDHGKVTFILASVQ